MPRSPTILCVDDEPMVLDSLREQFERQFAERYDIEVAQDALEALEIVDELTEEGVSIPVIICDHIMPGMKGDELLVRLKDRLPDTRKILLTGQAGLDAVGRAVNEAGLYRYITKPWDREDLAMTVREAMRGYLTEMQVRAQQERLVLSHEAAQRFVPYPFFDLLGRADLTEVQRGDCAVQDVTIYYSDIRGYTTLVEGHTPTDNLAWINEYVEWMEAPIAKHRGFICDINGDAVVALFGYGADGAVQAAIDSLRALTELNRSRAARNELPIRIGVGMTTGSVLIGVIGGENRLQCGVVGDPVNLAARLEGLTKHLGTHLVTGITRAALSDPDRYAMRYLDRVQVQGRTAPTELYEVLDGLPDAVRERRLATRDQLEEAIRRTQEGELDGASELFEAIARSDPDDKVVFWYQARIRALREASPGAAADVAVLSFK